MTKLTVTAKGQVTFKKDLLQHLGVAPGERIEVDKLPDGQVIVRAAGQNGRMADFIGCLSPRGRRKLSIQEINEIAAAGWTGAI